MTQPLKPFVLEDRYIVFARKKLDMATEKALEEVPEPYRVECLVVERDWDIYDQVLELIQDLYRRDQLNERFKKLTRAHIEDQRQILWDNGLRLYRMKYTREGRSIVDERCFPAENPEKAELMAMWYLRNIAGAKLISIELFNDLTPIGAQ